MFQEPVRVPAADRAFMEGQSDALKHLSAKPSYDPSTEQHREYMRGYHDAQGKQIKHGITKPEPVTTLIPAAEKAAKAEAKAAPTVSSGPAPVSSGMAMTRADFEREKMNKLEQAKAQAESVFAKPAAEVPGFVSAFKKKAASPS